MKTHLVFDTSSVHTSSTFYDLYFCTPPQSDIFTSEHMSTYFHLFITFRREFSFHQPSFSKFTLLATASFTSDKQIYFILSFFSIRFISVDILTTVHCPKTNALHLQLRAQNNINERRIKRRTKMKTRIHIQMILINSRVTYFNVIFLLKIINIFVRIQPKIKAM